MRTIRNCSVAVVGGAGFLGSHLVNHLIDDRGCKVLVIDNLVAGRHEFIHKGAHFLHHDITTSEAYLLNTFKQFEIQYVFNYAAYPYVPDSFARPSHVFSVNANGALNVINAAHEAGAEGIFQVSSAEIYGGCVQSDLAGTDGRITEDIPVLPHSSYGASKASIDAMVQVRWKEAKVPCIALRQFNCLGERETHPYIVPEIISQLQKQCYAPLDESSTTTVKLGNNSFRDFLYAGDAVRIAVELLERGQFGEVYNLGSETGIKMYDLARLIGKVMGFADVKVEKDESRVRPWEIWHLQSDNAKIRSVIATDSKYPYGSAHPSTSRLDELLSLEEALKRTVADYRANGCKWCWEK